MLAEGHENVARIPCRCTELVCEDVTLGNHARALFLTQTCNSVGFARACATILSLLRAVGICSTGSPDFDMD